MNAQQILDRQFLETRARILQIAADLDRLDRAEGAVAGDPRLAQLREGVEALLGDSAGRAERVQLIFSRHYDSEWKEQFGLATS